MKKHLVSCPKCGAFYSTEENENIKCEECGAALDRVNIPYSEWQEMTLEQKNAFKREYRSQMGIKRSGDEKPFAETKRTGGKKPFVPEGTPAGAKPVGCCGYIFLTMAFVGGLAALMVAGIWTALGVGIGCFATGMLFLLAETVANDVRQMKNAINQYMYDRESKNGGN